MSIPELTHLLLLARARAMDINNAIRLASAQLPAGSPGIAGWLAEQEVNNAAIAALEVQMKEAA